ncbi:MAG TPA: hypothetical protein VHY37_11370, partial [Tepidisphaeraceae bacterium]|nr:hypothetical protein [Tepidisphaeraceae bacterium]
PWIICGQIMYHWDPKKAAIWEASPKGYPSIEAALGKRYSELHQWQDAERCMKSYLAVSPDLAGYRALADLYQAQGRENLWLATLEDYLNKTPDASFDHAKVQKEIAEHFMDEGKYKEAIPFADATAQTQSLRGLLCAAKAHTGIGDFAGAEHLYREEMDSYSDSPFMWYTWCVQTGYGRLADARKALGAYFAAQGPYLPSEVLLQKAFVDFADGKTASAISGMKERNWQSPGPLSTLHILAFADDADDTAIRNEELLRRWSYLAPEQDLIKLVAQLSRGYRSGSDGRIDLRAIDALAAATPDKSDRVTINYLTANYLNKRGHKDLAAYYIKRCYTGFSGYCADRLLVDKLARELGLDPLRLSSEPTVVDDPKIEALKSAYQFPPRPALRPITLLRHPPPSPPQPLSLFTLALGIGEGKIPFLAITSLCAAIGLLGIALRRIGISATRELRGIPMYIAAALFCIPLLFWLLITHVSRFAATPSAQQAMLTSSSSTFLAIIWTPILGAIVIALAVASPKPPAASDGAP